MLPKPLEPTFELVLELPEWLLLLPWVSDPQTLPDSKGALLSTVTVFFKVVPLRIDCNSILRPSSPPAALEAEGGGRPGGGGGGGAGILLLPPLLSSRAG